MTDYTPTTKDVRGKYATHQGARYRGKKYLDLRRAEFDRWLEQVKAEAKADALADAGLPARPLPTREQIADAIWGTLDEVTGEYYPYDQADAVLALLKEQDA